MSRLTTAEVMRIAQIGARSARISAAGGLWRLPLLRWRHGLPFADRLLIIPQDLRSPDPSFADELRLGQFGLAGYSADLNGTSPFTIRPPSPEWTRELHGFGWLRHLRAEGSDEAREMARGHVIAWIAHTRRKHAIAWEAGTLGRRVTSWLCNASLLLDEAPRPVYDAVTDSLGAQLVALAAAWREAGTRLARLQALIALVLARLCIKGHDAELAQIEPALADELKAQILADGGHISRNPAVPIELLLDCLPLRRCFMARGRDIPPALETAIAGMMGMAYHLRLGDGMIARFNGMGATPVDELATVLSYDEGHARPGTGLPASRYARLLQGRTIILIDAGPPPDLDLAGSAHAGCLSFEMSSGGVPIFVNGGAPRSAGRRTLAGARATAAHNTLCINGTSSSKVIESPIVTGPDGGLAIRGPGTVTAALDETHGVLTFAGAHDGYLARFGMIHTRELRLAEDGCRIDGCDRLGSKDGTLRLARDLPFAIHFHLHRDIDCDVEAGSDAGPAALSVLLGLPGGETWRLKARGVQLSVEASTHYAAPSGLKASRQIVLRGASYGESTVEWTLTRA